MHDLIHPSVFPVIATNKSKEERRRLKEHLFVPFLVATHDRNKSGYIAPPRPTVHHALVDSGAQVGVVHAPMLTKHPELRQYFVEKKATLGGVGEVRCEQVGEL